MGGAPPLASLGVDDLAVYAQASAGQDEERRVLVATSVGLLDSWYAPRGSTARFSLSVRLYPWHAVHGVDLRGETSRLWAHEHQSRWRLRLSRPGPGHHGRHAGARAGAGRVRRCLLRMAQPSGPSRPRYPRTWMTPCPAFLGRAAKAESARPDPGRQRDARHQPAPTRSPAVTPPTRARAVPGAGGAAYPVAPQGRGPGSWSSSAARPARSGGLIRAISIASPKLKKRYPSSSAVR